MSQPSPAAHALSLNALPTEIRLMIYRRTWKPRLVRLDRKSSQEDRQEMGEHGHDGLRLRARSAPPLTMHISAESRRETLRHYKPFFKTESHTLYINPSLDVVVLTFFPRDELFRQPTEDLQRLLDYLSVPKHLALANASEKESQWLRNVVSQMQASRFPTLVTITNSRRTCPEVSACGLAEEVV
ncbi:uncharacterized protein THITE_160095 [Thermothielavioides terrestris NRRL 8126]|uniref:2EXR domain-containing protein n=1 Tax=Thermothielavioides terrestris (strain ATCC 38088 / NRRL 8126) TaxID=578455 RepID=G2R8N5_THETT|nr:uncharacterized protein THITE_160095 [Thermothielavioides terrestris NRRL 8126]AEO68251.1 hypothetical protein THITE_160095 [Thermothielavioides terrestris NRRL 8126]